MSGWCSGRDGVRAHVGSSVMFSACPPPPNTTVIVVTWRGRRHIDTCLDALTRQDQPHSVLVVDNASEDGTAEVLARHPHAGTVLRLPRNLGCAGALAEAVQQVKTRYVAWLNDDAAPEHSWLTALEAAMDEDPGAGAASPLLMDGNGATQSLGIRLTALGYGENATELVIPSAGGEVFGFCGGAALLRTDVLHAVGGVPARFFCYYEDTDTAWRMRLANWRVLAVPAARVRHQHGASTRLGSPAFHRWNERNRLLMLARCAPADTLMRELARFAAITVALPLRKVVGQRPPNAANFRFRLRVRVLAEVITDLPAALRERHLIGRLRGADRRTVWRTWAGR